MIYTWLDSPVGPLLLAGDGSLTGFGGGLERKRFLLDLEGRHSGLFAGA